MERVRGTLRAGEDSKSGSGAGVGCCWANRGRTWVGLVRGGDRPSQFKAREFHLLMKFTLQQVVAEKRPAKGDQ